VHRARALDKKKFFPHLAKVLIDPISLGSKSVKASNIFFLFWLHGFFKKGL